MSGGDQPGSGDPVHVVLALGTNLGDRDENLRTATAALAETDGLRLRGRSQIYETDAVGGPEQGPYLNAVVLADCWLSPFELLDVCHRIEADHHREREVRWGPRTLDIDVIAYGEIVDDDERLTLPHPRAHERAFVLVPWAQVDPEAHLPGPQGGRVDVLAQQAPDRLGLRKHPHRRPKL